MKQTITLLVLVFTLIVSTNAQPRRNSVNPTTRPTSTQNLLPKKIETVAQLKAEKRQPIQLPIAGTHQPSKASKKMLDSFVTFNYDSTQSEWIRSEKQAYFYNGALLVDSVIDYYTAGAAGWEKSSKTELSYNSNGLVSTALLSFCFWNDCQLYEKEEYKYNSNNQVTEYVVSYLDTTFTNFINAYKLIYSYDTKGLLTKEEGWDWSDSLQTWLNTSMSDYSYDANGFLVLEESKYIDTTGINWMRSDSTSFTNDSKGNPTKMIEHYWNDSAQKMLPEYYIEFNYDANGNTLKETEGFLNRTTSQLEPFLQTEFSYNVDMQAKDVVYPPYEFMNLVPTNNLFNNMLTEAMATYTDASIWFGNQKSNYYYSDIVATDIKTGNKNPLEIQVFPNPAKDVLFVSIPAENAGQFKLFNACGQLVINQQVSGTQTIACSQLEPGMYFYQIISNGAETMSKLIIE